MFNKTKNHALGLTLLGVFAFGQNLAFGQATVATCATKDSTNCCGNGKIETINGVTKECDLGFGLNTGGSDTDINANPLSGCTPSCKKASADWDCPDISTKQAELSNLYNKLVAAMINVKTATDTTTGAVTITSTPATSDNDRVYKVDPALCKYYPDPTTNPATNVLFADLSKQTQGTLDANKCAAYAADFYKFTRLNYSLPVTPEVCTAAHAITKPILDWAYTDLYNPFKITNGGQYTRYRPNYSHAYMINGCLPNTANTGPAVFTQ